MADFWKSPLKQGARGTAGGASYAGIIAGIVNGLMENITQENARMKKSSLTRFAEMAPPQTDGFAGPPRLTGREYGGF